MRRLVAIAMFAALAAACGGEPAAAPSTGSTSPSASPSGIPSPVTPPATSPSPSPASIQVPNDAPTTFAKSVASSDVPLQDLVPPGAQLTSEWRLPPSVDQVPAVALAWSRGPDPLAAEHGFEVWQQYPDTPPWRIAYAFFDGPATGVLAVRFDTGDLTGDGVVDALTFEDLGGSGACGVWRVIESGVGSATQIFHRKTCDTQIEIADGALQVRAAVYEPGDAHCCPSAYRTTTLKWDGTSWNRIDTVLTPASP